MEKWKKSVYIKNGIKCGYQYIWENEKEKNINLKREMFTHDVSVAIMVSLVRLSSG